MNKVIFPSTIHGTVNAPSSKSFMQRAIALSVLAEEETIIEHPSRCDDALAGLNIASSFGCQIYDNGSFISIIPDKKIKPKQLLCGESGLAIRLFAPIVSLFSHEVELVAEGSLLKRPADFMVEPFKQLQVKMTSTEGFPPLKIKGPLKAGIAELDGSLSSQFLSGLLIALPKANGNSILKVSNLKSIPYIDMTLQAVKAFGGKISNTNYQEFQIEGNQTYQADKYEIEGDWSGAAGLLVAGAIGGSVTVKILASDSNQADKAILDALEKAGAIIKMDKNGITVKQPVQLMAFEFDALHCPDLFPVLTALAANCQGTTKISGVHRLLHKESNRGEVLKDEFSKLGVFIEFEEDIMLISGGKINGGNVIAHNDHRIAMALTLAALNASGSVQISGAECVNKTYPDFFKDMETLGVEIN